VTTQPTRTVTRLLRAWSDGEEDALQQLTPLVEAELRRLARAYMARERRDHTLQATALVNEAFLKMVAQRGLTWQSRAHFFGIAAQAMRRILVDHARRRGSQKRGAGAEKVSLDDEIVIGTPKSDHMLSSLEDSLDRLAETHPKEARVVEMRFFGGLTFEECGCVLGVTPRTISKYWAFAQAWLYREMSR